MWFELVRWDHANEPSRPRSASPFLDLSIADRQCIAMTTLLVFKMLISCSDLSDASQWFRDMLCCCVFVVWRRKFDEFTFGFAIFFCYPLTDDSTPKDWLDGGYATSLSPSVCMCVFFSTRDVLDLFGAAAAAGFVVGGYITNAVSTCQMPKMQYHFKSLRFDTFRFQTMKWFHLNISMEWFARQWYKFSFQMIFGNWLLSMAIHWANVYFVWLCSLSDLIISDRDEREQSVALIVLIWAW